MLEQLEPASPAEAKQLGPELREQLKSITDPYRNNQGQLGLFTGANATGKTLAARDLARQFGYDIYRVDLAAVTSKYIGETEKNLSRLMDKGSTQDVVLLFDEADSLFAKRTEVSSANDRYANQETSYLLQRIEAFEGLVILATNSGNDLDQAMSRRVAWVVDFPLPAPKSRLSLWQRFLGWFRISSSG